MIGISEGGGREEYEDLLDAAVGRVGQARTDTDWDGLCGRV